MFIRLIVPVFRFKICVCPSFPFGTEGEMWDVILIPDHCLSIYLRYTLS